ncbi:MAG: hypothetical protein GY820_17070 [Gammaproteobacteria bacterium]|nr:hypothetical protein [Gammaproteobacteria bacterium]
MNMICAYCDTRLEKMEDCDPSGRFHEDCATELCKVCGRCCEIMLIPTRFEYTDMDSRIFFEKRGMTVVKDNMGGITLVIPKTCEHRVVDEGCNIYENRPYWCEIYEPWNDSFHAPLCPRCVEFGGKKIKRIKKNRPSEDQK